MGKETFILQDEYHPIASHSRGLSGRETPSSVIGP